MEVTDVFLAPSEEVKGEVDLYIATEFADRYLLKLTRLSKVAVTLLFVLKHGIFQS